MVGWLVLRHEWLQAGGSMQVGDLITHNPTGAVGIIVEERTGSVCVVWCYDPCIEGLDGEEEWIAKVFIDEFAKPDKK